MTNPFDSAGAKAPPKPFTVTEGRREVRSFVLRQGRFTPPSSARSTTAGRVSGWTSPASRAISTPPSAAMRARYWKSASATAPRCGLPRSRTRAVITSGWKSTRPAGRLLNALAEDNADHVRLYHHDAVEVLEKEIADGALDEVRIYFPDPWHKKRHNKRRLIQPAFADLLVRKLRAGGRLHCATDWEDYAEQMWEVLDATAGLTNRAGPRGQVERPEWRPQTHFETRGQKLGHGVWDLLYDRT